MSDLRKPTAASTWRRLCWLLVLVLLALAYWPVVSYLVENWWIDPNYSHGFLVPLVTAWLLWSRRRRLAAAAGNPSPWGLLVVGLGLVLLILGRWGHELFLQRISLVPVLWGLVLTYWGWPLARGALFPFAYLFFMIPLPYLIYDSLAFPLRLLSASLAGDMLRLWGLPVLVEGNIIHLPRNVLDVVNACSGIRSLVSLLAAAVILVYLWLRHFWSRALVVLMVPPVAVFTNSLRVVVAGILAEHYGPAMLEGATHDLVGWLVFLGAFGLVLVLTLLLARLEGGKKEVAP